MKSMFMEMVVQNMMNRRYAKRTIELYSTWIVSYIRFHQNKHPSDLHDTEVEAFLTDLVVRKNVAPQHRPVLLMQFHFYIEIF